MLPCLADRWEKSQGPPREPLQISLEAPPGFEPGVEDLQSSALPLGYGAGMERGTSVKPTKGFLVSQF